MMKKLKYKIVFLCYLTRRGVQKQKAFISGATEKVRISDSNQNVDKEIHMPLVTVEFFETKEEALKEAKIYCRPEDIKVDD